VNLNIDDDEDETPELHSKLNSLLQETRSKLQEQEKL